MLLPPKEGGGRDTAPCGGGPKSERVGPVGSHWPLKTSEGPSLAVPEAGSVL